jgi:nuclear receptor interaction protein
MQNTALRIHYENGQSEDIPLANDSVLTERERTAQRFAKATIDIKSVLFDNSAATSSDSTAQFTCALGRCTSIISDIDEEIRSWSYPINPSPEQVYAQRTLRRNRESVRRFVLAAGIVARVLGGRLPTPSGASPSMLHFVSVETSDNHLEMPSNERFIYDFIKAISLWLDSGIGRLIEGFTRPADVRSNAKAGLRLPIPDNDATTEAIEEYLIPYLLAIAGDEPVIDVSTNQFETDERRHVFSTRKAAVLAFALATRTPFADLSSAVAEAEGGEITQTQDRYAANEFWAGKVARGLLLDVSQGITAQFVDRAFGGANLVDRGTIEEEISMAAAGIAGDSDSVVRGVGVASIEERIPEYDTDLTSEDLRLLREFEGYLDQRVEEGQPGRLSTLEDEDEELREQIELEELLNQPNGDEESDDHFGLQEMLNQSDEGDDDDDGDEQDEDEDEDGEGEDAYAESEDSSEPDEEDGVPNLGVPRLIFRSAAERRRQRSQVERDIPCYGPTRSYKGHCNVQTVKDVNYFGPDDEYVVSGSDDGNLFIWDRKTSQLVNILEGDGEVVNVIQGHPYETMLAVSGIDHTIKIFSPDARARQVARLGQGVSAHDAASFSSLSWPPRRGPRRPIGVRQPARESAVDDNEEGASSEQAAAQRQALSAEEDDNYVAPNGLTSRKRVHEAELIVQRNQRQREDGNQEAVITVSVSLPFQSCTSTFPISLFTLLASSNVSPKALKNLIF